MNEYWKEKHGGKSEKEDKEKMEGMEMENPLKEEKDNDDTSDKTTARENISPKTDDRELDFVQRLTRFHGRNSRR